MRISDWSSDVCSSDLPRPGGPTPIYASAEPLLAKTVAFNRAMWRERLDVYFGGAHRFLDAHFGGPNPYSAAIDVHLARIGHLVRGKRLAELKLDRKSTRLDSSN